MKNNHRFNHPLTMVLTAALLVCGVIASAEAKSDRTTLQRNAAARSAGQPARLIIHRLPTLGANVIVDVYVDGAPFGSATYGRTLDESLPAGRHVVSVLATPAPTYVTRTAATIDFRSGETYTFTAEDNGSGNLILR